jgi:ketosteroid isomerase-like protein
METHMTIRRRNLVAAALAVPTAMALTGTRDAWADAGGSRDLPYPLVADTSAASPDLVQFMEAFFAAKTRRQLDKTMSFFSRNLVTYTDSTLGLVALSWEQMYGFFAQFMASWPDTAKSYPTRIIGDMNSALVAFTDTPELFGGELRLLGAIDFKDGKIVRWVDYWDARGWPNQFGLSKSPVADFHTAELGERASAQLRNVATSLMDAWSRGSADSAAALFSFDAVYEDLALRTSVAGRAAIGRYLGRSLGQLPFGTGAALRHVVGSAQGGGFEWIGSASTPLHAGVTALVLDGDGLITRASTTYDGTMLLPSQVAALVPLALDP